MSLPLPAILTFRLIIKNGDPLTSCRNKTDPIDFFFQIDRGFRLFKAQIATEFIRRLPNDWQDDFSVYLKPTKHAPQREFPELDEQNFSSRVARSWELARLRLHVIQVQVHVGNLQESLGLPAYSLRPPFRDPVDFETPAPAEDMDDIDHLSDQL
ncbi:uncharacterized protein PITG_09945 [Phytophthora infestans T30-4]|uniref:Uncharacterized protein n=1 Tax=Phytophthora infestans (strain T30-4) TaxID=403677 RepID=D0NDX2_PHYIT|nr:uncharacterized protein PITG_09945 [Phytophthora infestans T30-4]EEY56417.1 conserved hypothetical protein [Phytophthora infestans T30-4]|eukprot:XP_002902491.1 conserved hypothetical protein [Phytophthora infestans T30-4]